MISKVCLAVPFVALTMFSSGCAADALEGEAGDEQASEEAISTALSSPVYECLMRDADDARDKEIPRKATVVVQGRKAVVELEREKNRKELSGGGYYGPSETKLSEDGAVSKRGKVFTVKAEGWALAIDTSKATTPATFSSTFSEGEKTFSHDCHGLSHGDWFNDHARTSRAPNKVIHAEALTLPQLPALLRDKMKAASSAIDAHAEGTSLSEGSRYFAVYFTGSKKTLAGYLVWAGSEDGADGEIERTIWTVAFDPNGKEIMREFADLRG